MPTKTLPPNTHIKFTLDAGHRRIRFKVEAEAPVTTYLLDETGLDAFKRGENPKNFAFVAVSQIASHDASVRAARVAALYLLILNELDVAVVVHYDVFS